MLSTATLERINTDHTTFPESVVPCPPGPRSGNQVDLYVTDIWGGTAASGPHRDLIGTVRKATSTGPGMGWAIPVGDEPHEYVRGSGSLINPEPVNGRHYRVLTPDGGGQLLRYNDAEHMGDRNRGLHPWSVVAGAGGAPWPYPNDSIDRPEVFVEVEYETAGRSGGNEEEVPAAEVPATIGNDADGPTRGRAHVEADGTVLLNPEPVPGEMYLMWVQGAAPGSATTLALHLEGDHFAGLGYFYSSGDDSLWSGSSRTSAPPVGSRSWVKAALVPVLTGSEEEQAAELRSARGLEQAESINWDAMDEALSGLAKEKEWCSEFESVVEPLGFSPRETKCDWEVTVTAQVTVSIDSPDSAIDSRIESYYDLPGLSTTSMSLDGSVTVTISVDESTEDEARNYVDTDAIISAMDSSADVEIRDWEIDSVRES